MKTARFLGNDKARFADESFADNSKTITCGCKLREWEKLRNEVRA